MARLSPFSSASAGTVTVTVAWLGASSVMYSSLRPASCWMKLVLLDQLLRLVGQGPFLGRVFVGFHQHDASFLPLDDRCRAVRRAWLRSSAHTGGRAGHGVYGSDDSAEI